MAVSALRPRRPSSTGRSPEAPSPYPPLSLLRQAWLDVSFVHWEVDPAAVAPLLPPGTRPDTLDGVTYAGLVAFRVPSSLVAGAVPTGAFGEVNVRLYSVDERGRRGVVFLTMDADSAPLVAAARAVTGLPYVWSDVSVRGGPGGPGPGGRRAGAVERRFPGTAHGSWSLDVGDPVPEPGPLERFLTARWGLHTRHLGRTRWVQIHHQPWPLHRARLRHLDGDLLTAAGVEPLTGEPASVLWSPGLTCELLPFPV
ncbi:DUF2071 domain-containing protein [Nocardiopsis sp. HNM0947]|uniref:DUF2071 domain-containing protein n=1 Tax=Nocardiopsis coralli TaxID=2772213 RepID=A0ABR9PBZ1_9ACTN|nr:DUF2071 domain-containing protein [Nocardiopsis coralli]MBE3001360.1 DUF2071 domain-containing protein [Nocardiopsis coralli]